MEAIPVDLIFAADFQEKLPVFHQKWWLDIVAPHIWRYIAVGEGDFIGIWPILSVRKACFRMSKMPPLTPYLGPWICTSNSRKPLHLSAEIGVHEKLIERLPAFDVFKQRFHPRIRQWLAFYWKGFCQTTRYTFKVDTKEDSEVLWRRLSETRRRRVRKGEKCLKIEEEKSVDGEFFQLVRMTYSRRGIKVPFSEVLLGNICSESVARNMGKIFYAIDAGSGEKVAVMFLIWDKYSVYYLIGAYRDSHGDSYASSLLLWRGILFAKEMGLEFDFEGSMVKGINYFFRSFGGELVPYFEIAKVESRILRLFYSLK